MNPWQITRSVRSLNRLRRIAHVLSQHGFGHIVTRINLSRFVPVWALPKQLAAKPVVESPESIGRRIVQVCNELGPTFIKLGQMLSTRGDLLPDDVINELRSLQDDVPPFDNTIARDIIARELKRPVEECFAELSPLPLASGSIGQVYRAVSLGGTSLVVKVRRPDIDDTVKLDLQLLTWLAESLENLIPEARMYRPTMLVNELDQMLTRELDYINEASATARFERAFTEDEGVRIPKVYWDFTTQRVLTLQAIDGDNVERSLRKCESGDFHLDRGLAAKQLADAFLKQVFELGAFHADPHPGNILIDPPSTVGLIDFGQVGTISDEMMTQIVVMVYAAVSREVNVVVDSLADLGALGPETDRANLARALQVLLDKYYGLPVKRLQLDTLLNEFTEVVRRHDVVIPREVFMLLKSIGMVSTVITRLDPDLNLLELLQVRLQRTFRERLSPKRLTREASVLGWHLISILRYTPARLRDLLRNVSTGGLRMHVEHENLDRVTQELDRSSNRLAFSIVIAAIIVGSSVVLSAGSQITIIGIKLQTFGVIGYLVAGILGLGLSWAIFRSGRLH